MQARIRRSAFVPFDAVEMCALVNDVDAYPQFLPWCVGARVLRRDDKLTRAQIDVKKGPLNHTLTTDNLFDEGKSIAMHLVDGPFRTLHGEWTFEDADDGCIVSLRLEFEFSSRLVSGALTAAFKPIANSLVDAFKRRAYDVFDRA